MRRKVVLMTAFDCVNLNRGVFYVVGHAISPEACSAIFDFAIADQV
tara:strand:- start:2713 stop:2850 length:138 start_codon:yes stop_codon:yes gene_type:complete